LEGFFRELPKDQTGSAIRYGTLPHWREKLLGKSPFDEMIFNV